MLQFGPNFTLPHLKLSMYFCICMYVYYQTKQVVMLHFLYYKQTTYYQQLAVEVPIMQLT